MLDNIMLFVKLVEAGSFRKVAAQMNIQHSTVSKHISQLESSINKVLILRDNREFELTQDGKFLYERFKHIDSYTDNTLRTFNTSPQSDLAGDITIALPGILSYEMVCPFIGQFSESFPNINLNLIFHYAKIKNTNSVENTKSAKKYLEQVLTSSDMMLTTNNAINLPNYDYRFMRNESLKLYCTPAYAQRYGIPTTVEELNNHITLGGIDHFAFKAFDYVKLTHIDTKQEYMFDNSKTRIRSNSALHNKKIGMTTNCIFACWEVLCIKELKEGSLIQVLPKWTANDLDFYLISRKSLTTAEKEVVKFLYRCLGYSGV